MVRRIVYMSKVMLHVIFDLGYKVLSLGQAAA